MSKKNKTKLVRWAVLLGLLSLLLVNLAGWSLYSAVHDILSLSLANYFGVGNDILQNLLIVAICIVLVVLISGIKLNKAIREMLD